MVKYLVGLKIFCLTGKSKSFLEMCTAHLAVCYNWCSSRLCPGPLLFIIYINDLPISIFSKIRLYADDVIIYRAILSSEDASVLQEDLNKLVNWAATWLMSLNLNKCEHL